MLQQRTLCAGLRYGAKRILGQQRSQVLRTLPQPTNVPRNFSSASAALAQRQATSTVEAPTLTVDALKHLSSDDSTRRGYQLFNIEDTSVVNTKTGFDTWSFDNEEVGMIVPDFHRPSKYADHVLQIEECIVDCDKLASDGDGLRSIFTLNDQGKVVLDRNKRLAEDLTALLHDVYTKWGVVLLRNTNLTDVAGRGDALKLEQVSQLLFTDKAEPYTAGSNLRGQVDTETNVYDTGAPRSAHLHYHHEMQYVNRSPKNISFLALAVPRSSSTGATYVSYNPAVTHDLLQTECGQKLADKGACYVRKMPDLRHFQNGSNVDPRIVYNFWQTSMNTEDPVEAQAVAEAAGLIVDWEDSPVFGRYMVTRFYMDAFEYDPDFMKKNQLFFSVADDWMWFDTWPGLAEIAPQHRPLAIEYGDGTPFTHAEKQLLCDVYDNHGFPVTWDKPGDMAMICNRRTAHGRPEYDIDEAGGEERELGVLLGARFARQGQRAGRW